MRITLCGSTRFEPLFHEWNLKLALAGHTVYSLSAFGRQASDIDKDNELILSDAEKITFDLVHLDKILNSDAIVVLNVSNYVGESTSREIQWARMRGKLVYWLEVYSVAQLSIEQLCAYPTAPAVAEPEVYPEPSLVMAPVPDTVIPLVPRHPAPPSQPTLDDDIPF